MNAGFSSLFRTSVQPLSSFLRASVLPSSASTLPSVCSTYVRPLSHLSLMGFVAFVVFTLRCHPLFILRCQLFLFITGAHSHTIFHFFYLMKCLGNVVNSPACLLFFIIRRYFSFYMNAGICSLWRTSVQGLSSFLRASVLPPSSSSLPSVQPPTFVRFRTFLCWVLSLS